MHDVGCSTKEDTRWIIPHLKPAEGIVVTVHRQRFKFSCGPNHTQLFNFSGIEEAACNIRIIKIIVNAITGTVVADSMFTVTNEPTTNLVTLFAIVDNKKKWTDDVHLYPFRTQLHRYAK